jgi:hypothetical protein
LPKTCNTINWGLLGIGKPPPPPQNSESFIVLIYYCANEFFGGVWPPNHTSIYFESDLEKAIERVTTSIYEYDEDIPIEEVVNDDGFNYKKYLEGINFEKRMKEALKDNVNFPYVAACMPNIFLKGCKQIFDFQLTNNEMTTHEMYIFYKPRGV